MRLVVSYGCHSVVCVSVRPFVCLCFAHIGEPCQQCWIDRDTIWRTDTIEHKGTMYRGVHIGATYRIRVNDSCGGDAASCQTLLRQQIVWIRRCRNSYCDELSLFRVLCVFIWLRRPVPTKCAIYFFHILRHVEQFEIAKRPSGHWSSLLMTLFVGQQCYAIPVSCQ